MADRDTGHYGIIGENMGKQRLFLCLRVLGPRRHPRGFPDPVGFILVEYEPEQSHIDMIRIIFHVLEQSSVFTSCMSAVWRLYMCCIKIVYLLYIETVCTKPTQCLCVAHTERAWAG